MPLHAAVRRRESRQQSTLLELASFLAALEHLAESGSPERVVALATNLEALQTPLNRPRALARVVEIRAAIAQRLGEWSHARFLAEATAIERLIDKGHYREAVAAAQALHTKREATGEAYDGAAYDGAVAQVTLGRALRRSGGAEVGLPQLESARQRFERLNQARMGSVALVEAADCLRDLGRYGEAADAY
jgi:hypothetical protein